MPGRPLGASEGCRFDECVAALAPAALPHGAARRRLRRGARGRGPPRAADPLRRVRLTRVMEGASRHRRCGAQPADRELGARAPDGLAGPRRVPDRTRAGRAWRRRRRRATAGRPVAPAHRAILPHLRLCGRGPRRPEGEPDRELQWSWAVAVRGPLGARHERGRSAACRDDRSRHRGIRAALLAAGRTRGGVRPECRAGRRSRGRRADHEVAGLARRAGRRGVGVAARSLATGPRP